MAPLINKNDNEITKNIKFVKNAVFYKDLFAFYDAYTLIMSEDKKYLPNYIYDSKKGYILEGICFMMKDYASEFNFESLVLSLDYLKVLYYTIASFSENEEFPEKKIIEMEYENYKKASYETSKLERKEYQEQLEKYKETCRAFDECSSKYAKCLVLSKTFNVLSIFFLILGFFLGSLTFMIYYYTDLSLTTTWIISIAYVVFGFLLMFLFKYLMQKYENKAGEVNYLLNQKKKIKENANKEFEQVKSKFSKIECEKYEYQNNFAEQFSLYVKKDGFKTIMKKASEYKILSYNLKLDIENLFISQDGEIRDMISQIDRAGTFDEPGKYLHDLYMNIESKDWLYYNQELRFAFLKKFADESEKSFNWKLELDGEKIDPFGVNIKGMVKEKISYLKSSDSLFVASTLDRFLSTKYIKNSNTLKLNQVKNADTLRKVKLEYMSHFCDYDKTKSYDNLFYDKNLSSKAKISDEIIGDVQKIPTFVQMKLRSIETKIGLQNSNFDIISRISDDIAYSESSITYEPQEKVNIPEVKKVDIVSEDINVEDFGYYVSYNVGGNKYIGYKFI